MSQKPDQPSSGGGIQVFKLTMDNPEDEDELNRNLLARTRHMTHVEQIWNAVRELVGQDENRAFSREEVRQQVGVSQEDWQQGYTSIFQGMREDQPGGAPSVRRDFNNVFQQISRGNYTLSKDGKKLLKSQPATPAINVEDQDLSEEEIDQALRANVLRLGLVPTDSRAAQVRQRMGQARIRKLTVENYQSRCAVCDVTDNDLLVASHIVGWAEAPEHRGDLSNVICLCRIHDALFETGYWSLDNNMGLLRKKPVTSKTICQLLDSMTSFRKPLAFPPAPKFVEWHHNKSGFAVGYTG